MNSILKHAPAKVTAPRAGGNTSLTRNLWKHMLGLALVTLFSIASAFAGAGIQIADQGMFRPRGMVRSFVFVPANGAVAAHVLSDYWVSDGASGFCRINRNADPRLPASAGGLRGTLDLTTCYLPGINEPFDMQAQTFGVNGSNGYVFVAGVKEITRLEFMVDPLDPTKTAINPATQVRIFDGAASVFTNGASAASPRFVESVRMGPDGKLYMCFQGSGDIWRVRNPLSPTFTPAGNAVERVGTSDNGKTLLSIGWIGHDLWMQQAGFLNRIQNADQCFYTFPKCQAILEFGKLQTQEGMATDQFDTNNPNGRYLYWGNGNRVVRFDTFSVFDMRVWNQTGFVNGSTIPQEYSLIMGLGFIQPALPNFPANPVDALNPGLRPLVKLTDPTTVNGFVSEMTASTDPIIEAPPPGVPAAQQRTGKTWSYAASAGLVAEPCQSTPPNPPPCINSQIGNDSPANGTPAHDAARRAVLLLAGVTHPKGVIFLQTNWWVSDEDNGFCRIDVNPISGAGFMNACFQPFGFIPGQAAAAAPDLAGNQTVYVPDSSGNSRGIIRLVFTPDGNGGTVSQTGFLNAGPGTVSAVALPTGPFNDGALYISYFNGNKIDKIGSPNGAPTAPTAVGGVNKGVGVMALAFNGNDLYMTELAPPANTNGQLTKGGQITFLRSASPDLTRGGAQILTKPISRLQSPAPGTTPQTFLDPAGLVVGPVGDREACLPPPGVVLSPSVPKDPTTAHGLYYGGLGAPPAGPLTGPLGQDPEVDQFGFVCTTEIPWVLQAALDPLHSINVPVGPVLALGFNSMAGNANLAIADDPGIILPPQTLQNSQIRPPTTGAHGQGHVFIVQ